MTAGEIVATTKITSVWEWLGGTHDKGRGIAFYRGGDNKNAVALDDAKGTWFDHRDGIGGGVLDLIQRVLQCSRSAAAEWLAEQAGAELDATRQRDKRPPIIAEYSYTDELGNLLYQIIREAPKKFKQRQPDGQGGGWIWRGPKDEAKVLYRLVEVTENPIIFLVEGERDVETLRSYGFVATTNAGGAKAPWLPQYTEALCGREVILIPDNDVPGRQRAASIARALLGHVAKLIALELDDDCKDITEWFEKGHSEVELIACLEEVAHHAS